MNKPYIAHVSVLFLTFFGSPLLKAGSPVGMDKIVNHRAWGGFTVSQKVWTDNLATIRLKNQAFELGIASKTAVLNGLYWAIPLQRSFQLYGMVLPTAAMARLAWASPWKKMAFNLQIWLNSQGIHINSGIQSLSAKPLVLSQFLRTILDRPYLKAMAPARRRQGARRYHPTPPTHSQWDASVEWKEGEGPAATALSSRSVPANQSAAAQTSLRRDPKQRRATNATRSERVLDVRSERQQVRDDQRTLAQMRPLEAQEQEQPFEQLRELMQRMTSEQRALARMQALNPQDREELSLLSQRSLERRQALVQRATERRAALERQVQMDQARFELQTQLRQMLEEQPLEDLVQKVLEQFETMETQAIEQLETLVQHSTDALQALRMHDSDQLSSVAREGWIRLFWSPIMQGVEEKLELIHQQELERLKALIDPALRQISFRERQDMERLRSMRLEGEVPAFETLASRARTILLTRLRRSAVHRLVRKQRVLDPLRALAEEVRGQLRFLERKAKEQMIEEDLNLLNRWDMARRWVLEGQATERQKALEEPQAQVELQILLEQALVQQPLEDLVRQTKEQLEALEQQIVGQMGDVVQQTVDPLQALLQQDVELLSSAERVAWSKALWSPFPQIEAELEAVEWQGREGLKTQLRKTIDRITALEEQDSKRLRKMDLEGQVPPFEPLAQKARGMLVAQGRRVLAALELQKKRAMEPLVTLADQAHERLQVVAPLALGQSAGA